MEFFKSTTGLFNVWPNRRQLDSHICFCIQFVKVSRQVTCGKIPLYAYKLNNFLVFSQTTK